MVTVIIIAILTPIIVCQYINIRNLKLDDEIAKLSIKEIRNNYEMRIRILECDSSQVDALEKKNAELLMEITQLKSTIDYIGNCTDGQTTRRRFLKIPWMLSDTP